MGWACIKAHVYNGKKIIVLTVQAFTAALLMLATSVLCYNYLVDYACIVITLLDKGSVLYKTT